MYARLWWKEARTFWPIWLALGVVALGLRGLMLWVDPSDVRTGVLIPLSLGLAVLHAFAVGAAAFAGEREVSTQVFLDTLPVDRKMLWTSKVSFAMATTLAMALAMVALGAWGSADRDPARFPLGDLARDFGLVLFEALAWSLLWSVMLDAALPAAVLGLATEGLVLMLVSQDVNVLGAPVLAQAAAIRMALAGGALLLSWIVFMRGPRPGRAGRARETSVPATSIPPVREAVRRLLWTGLPLVWAGTVAGLSLGALLGRSHADVVLWALLGILAGHWAVSRLPRDRVLDTRWGRLAWETVRESRRTWLPLAGAGIGFPLLAVLGPRRTDGAFWLIPGILTSLAAGVSVFGPATRTRSYRFLAHHGVRPGAAWSARVVVWGVVMAFLIAPTLIVAPVWWSRRDTSAGPRVVLLIVAAFSVALFCGQVFRRNITAWVVACLAFVVLVSPQFGLVEAGMIPVGSLALFPSLVLAITWAWTGDWMNDLRGAGRWLRLAAMAGVAAAVLVASYIGYRAWSVPDIGPPFALETAPTSPVPLDPDQDAAPDYARILADLPALIPDRIDPGGSHTVNRVVVEGWEPKPAAAAAWWDARRGLIEPLRRAAEKPSARFSHPDLMDSSIDGRLARLPSLVWLLGLDSSERRSRGDLDGAWEDLRAAFRISAHASQGGAITEAMIASRLRVQALQWALAWASDPRQTPARLRSALADFRALPPLASVPESLRAEYGLVERTFRRAERDPDVLIPGGFKAPRWSPVLRSLYPALLLPSWERERARRVLRLIFAEQLQLARLEPWEQSARQEVRPTGLIDLHLTRGKTEAVVRASDLAWYVASTPLVANIRRGGESLLQSSSQEVLLRRSFEQVVALRIWQLEHGGQYPRSLEALVPDILPALPPDPYSGRPFRYGPARGQTLLPLGWSGLAREVTGPTSRARPARPGQWLLYSVGPNGRDDGAGMDYETFPASSDLIFPLPASGANPRAPTSERETPGAVAPR